MNYEDAVWKLSQEEDRANGNQINLEECEVMRNLGIIANMLQQAMDKLQDRETLVYEDMEQIIGFQSDCMRAIGDILEVINKYS